MLQHLQNKYIISQLLDENIHLRKLIQFIKFSQN